jgi:hypothetical protein
LRRAAAAEAQLHKYYRSKISGPVRSIHLWAYADDIIVLKKQLKRDLEGATDDAAADALSSTFADSKTTLEGEYSDKVGR